MTMDSGASAGFLTAMYGESVAPAHLLIWELAGKRSTWHQDITAAKRYAIEASARGDVYYGLCLSPEDRGPAKRCAADSVIAVPGVWLDIDYGVVGHKKPNLPGDLNDAVDLLMALPLQPTEVVDSGGGLQVYWLFPELLPVFDETGRAEAASLVKRWLRYAQDVARKLGRERGEPEGWDVDATFDLARVLRVPGTLNHKHEPPKPVTTLTEIGCGRRYSVADLLAALPAPDHADEFADQQTQRRLGELRETITDGGLVLRPDAQPDWSRIGPMCMLDAEFSQTWNRQREDFADKSASSYDMAIATRLLVNGFDPQQVANHMIAWRRIHGDQDDITKATRADYVARTLARAQSWVDQHHADQQLKQIAYAHERQQGASPAEAAAAADSVNPDDPDKVLELLSQRFQVKLDEIYVIWGDENVYRMVVGERLIQLGGVNALLQFRQFRAKLADVSGVLVPTMKDGEWLPYAQNLLRIAHLSAKHPGDASDTLTRISDQILEYLDVNRPPTDRELAYRAALSRKSFCQGGYVYIFAGGDSGLAQHLRLLDDPTSNGSSLAQNLRDIGWQSVNKTVWYDNHSICRSVWRRSLTAINDAREFRRRKSAENAASEIPNDPNADEA
jgi:hypothetical protein